MKIDNLINVKKSFNGLVYIKAFEEENLNFSNLIVVSDASSLPTTVISGRIALIQLIAELFVPSHVQDGDTERSLTTELGIGLLYVAQIRDEVLTRYGLLILQKVALSNQSKLVNKHVRVRCDSRH